MRWRVATWPTGWPRIFGDAGGREDRLVSGGFSVVVLPLGPRKPKTFAGLNRKRQAMSARYGFFRQKPIA